MTRQEALDRMRMLGSGDEEADHREADDILCEFLRTLGYEALVDAWDNVGKWYA